MDNPSPTPFFLTEETARPIGRQACRLNAYLLPTWQKPNDETVKFIAVMLQAAAAGNLVFLLGRAFYRELLALVTQAEAYELIQDLQNAIDLGCNLLDEDGTLDPTNWTRRYFCPFWVATTVQIISGLIRPY